MLFLPEKWSDIMEVILETQGLCKSFGEQKVNNDISLKLHKGEIMAI